MSTSDLSDSSHAGVGLGKQLSSERSCVACQNVPDACSSLKILNCLHTMCVPCLKDNVNKDGTVSCFNCLQVGGSALPGIRLEDSLVDWPKTDRRVQTSSSASEISCAGEVLSSNEWSEEEPETNNDRPEIDVQNESSQEWSETEKLESSNEESETEVQAESNNEMSETEMQPESSNKESETDGQADRNNEVSETEVQAESSNKESETDGQADRNNEVSETVTQAESSNEKPEAEVLQMCQKQDCEGELVPAVSFCIDCGVHMCGDHEKLHLKRKATAHGHRIVPVVSKSGVKRNMCAEFKCQLHPQHTVKSYCTKCKMLTCEQCCVRIHLHCTKDVEDIHTAAERKREDWKARLKACSNSWREKLSNTRIIIDEYTEEINDEVEELSETINADFEEHIRNIRRRQQKILDDLDAIRWDSLHRLEKQSEIIVAKMYQLDSCEHLVRNLGDSGLLAAEKILSPAIKDVEDANNDSSGESDILPDAEYSLQVSYPEFAADESVYVAMLGELIISSNSDGAEPMKKQGHAYPGVDVFSCDTTALTVTDNGHALSCSADKWTPIATLGSYCHGVVECVIKIDKKGRGLFLGVTTENCDKRIVCAESKKFLGWFSSNHNAKLCVGNNSTLGQPWRQYDVITLRLDSDQHTLTGVHKRTGQSQTISVPARKLCFAAELKEGSMKFLR